MMDGDLEIAAPGISRSLADSSEAALKVQRGGKPRHSKAFGSGCEEQLYLA
jgi:hypothetical protein